MGHQRWQFEKRERQYYEFCVVAELFIAILRKVTHQREQKSKNIAMLKASN